MKNLIQSPIKKGQFIAQVTPKRNITLHHTVSSTARSALTWWDMDPARVATPFVLEKDGRVFQAFDEKYWAYHLGLKHTRNEELNKCSIPIEIVNEGPLIKAADGSFRWNFGPARPQGSPYKGEVFTASKPWRGFQYWAAYTPEQYAALSELVQWLLVIYNLPPTIAITDKCNVFIPDQYTIYAHHHVRADKTDVSPAFDYSKLIITQPLV